MLDLIASEILRLDSYSAGYSGLIFSEVSLRVGSGDLLLVSGGNGAGKSTFLRGVLGLTPVENGEIYFLGRDISSFSVGDRVSLGMAYLHQNTGIFETLSIRDNIRLGWALGRRERSGLVGFLEEVGRRFPWTKGRWGERAGHLSGGERRIIGVARALASGARLLLLDEPLAGVASSNRHNVINWVKDNISVLKASAIWVEHRAPELEKVSTNRLVLRTVVEGELNGDVATREQPPDL